MRATTLAQLRLSSGRSPNSTLGGGTAHQGPDTSTPDHGRHRLPCEAAPDLWWPEGYTGRWESIVEHAIAGCQQCPVMTACRQWALANGEQEGIWGATTPAERRALRRHRRGAA